MSGNVFVIGAGKCGTHTFFHAASHATNCTCSHEWYAKRGMLNTLQYPQSHIAIGWPIVIHAGRLIEKYPAAKWVHLRRLDRAACVDSLSRAEWAMQQFAGMWAFNPTLPTAQVAAVWYECLDSLCAMICERAHESLTIELENIKSQWRKCWEFMGCEGDYDASLAEWEHRYRAEGNQACGNRPATDVPSSVRLLLLPARRHAEHPSVAGGAGRNP